MEDSFKFTLINQEKIKLKTEHITFFLYGKEILKFLNIQNQFTYDLEFGLTLWKIHTEERKLYKDLKYAIQ